MLSEALAILRFLISVYRKFKGAKDDAEVRLALDKAKATKDTSDLERLIGQRMRDS
jgi:hypothetical protein